MEFAEATRQSDEFKIELPSGYRVDEVPSPLELSYPFAAYRSSYAVSETAVEYKRTFEVKDLLIGVEDLDDLKDFFQKVAEDERARVVLDKLHP